MLMMLRGVTYQSCVAMGMRFKVVAERRALGRTELLICTLQVCASLMYLCQ